MIRIPGRIPIIIHPAFWLIAAVIGFFNSRTLIGTLVWIGIIFVSVLFHELGHALTAVLFKQNPRIELVALGGVTYHNGDKLRFVKQFFIVFNGPLFGFLLYVIATLVLNFTPLNTGYIGAILRTLQWVNLFWTVLNLIPILPLDGGQLLRIILEGVFGVRGLKYALMTSMIFAVGVSLFFFITQAFLIGALFFLLAFQSYDTWKKTRSMAEPDRKESLKKALETAEATLIAGRKEEAMQNFERIREETKSGLIHTSATQYLAFLKYELGKFRDVYQMLLPLKSELHAEGLCLLHRAAFDEKDYALVVELSGKCFQTLPTAETALRNAYASASLSQSRPAVGWLQTAVKEGLKNLKEVIQESSFDPIRDDPLFQEFVKTHAS